MQHRRRCFSELWEGKELPGVSALSDKCITNAYMMLDACAKCCSMSRASKLLEDVEETCVEPVFITYTTIIKVYCVEDIEDRGFHSLEEMKKVGKLRPNEVMYN